jgi:hypothetical protein
MTSHEGLTEAERERALAIMNEVSRALYEKDPAEVGAALAGVVAAFVVNLTEDPERIAEGIDALAYDAKNMALGSLALDRGSTPQ